MTPREVSEADGLTKNTIFDPEQANQYEFGLKNNLYKKKHHFSID
jgi:iron complex outermembrane receptor protein